MGKSKAIAFAGVSLILVVGAVVGVVAYRSRHSSNNEGNAELSTNTKAVNAICEPTSYKDVCRRTLGEVARNETADPRDFIKVAVTATLDEVRTALGVLEKDYKKTNEFSLKVCKDLLNFSIYDLERTLLVAVNDELNRVIERVPDLAIWLSAVIAYQQNCFDETLNPELKMAMQNELLNATQLTSNALAIVVEFAQILNSLNIPVDIIPKSRRLLEAQATQVDSEGYPTWFPASERKLLQVHPKGTGTQALQRKPDAVVAQDGSGQFKKIKDALASYPPNHKGRFIIHVKAGIYYENVTVTQQQPNVYMYGDGLEKTIVTGHGSNGTGFGTMYSATFSVVGNGFICKDMGFQNTAGAKNHQAVALRVQSDFSVFYRCKIEGYQDTLYAQTYRQFYRECYISGTVDFIFGDSATVIQNSQIAVRKPDPGQKNTVTAQGRYDKMEPTGLLIQNCTISPEKELDIALKATLKEKAKIKTYLGRPWKLHAVTVIMESKLEAFIHPEGWKPWDKREWNSTNAEYANRGPGANTTGRVKWVKRIDRNLALSKYTVRNFYQTDKQNRDWLKVAEVPFYSDLLDLKG